jgi:tight adherence protein B
VNDTIWVPAALVFLAAVAGTVALAMLSEAVRDWWRRREVARRVKPVLIGQARRGRDVHDLVRGEDELNGFLGVASRLVPGLRGLEGLLEQARLDWSPGTFLILMLGVGAGAGAAAFVVTGSLVWFAVFAIGGAFAPYVYAARRRTRRFRQFEEELPQGIDLLTRAIRAGHPLSSAMGMVADEGPPEVSMEFRRVFEEQRFGIPFEEALLGLVDRTDMMDVRIFAIAVIVQREVGGNLAEILDNLAHTIRRRFRLRRQLRVYTAQGRLTGYALAALPVVVGLAIYLINPEFMEILFTHLLGQIMLVMALLLQALGGLWIRKIISIDM